MREKPLLFLRESENALILTKAGMFIRGITHEITDLHENADTVQGMMIEMMKHSGANQGLWVWKIEEDWRIIMGREMGEDECVG